jgi:hypothetical protein
MSRENTRCNDWPDCPICVNVPKPGKLGSLASANCSASEPVRRSWSQDELRDAALDWMRKNYSDLLKSDPDKYHIRLGVLVDFVTDLMQNEKDQL